VKIRKHIYFSGRVQGVGFRYRSKYLAEPLGLTGWVENLWDGRVEMEIQGEDLAIRRFLNHLRVQPFVRITDMELSALPLVEDERGFSVQGY